MNKHHIGNVKNLINATAFNLIKKIWPSLAEGTITSV